MAKNIPVQKGRVGAKITFTSWEGRETREERVGMY